MSVWNDIRKKSLGKEQREENKTIIKDVKNEVDWIRSIGYIEPTPTFKEYVNDVSKDKYEETYEDYYAIWRDRYEDDNDIDINGFKL